jgi:ketosteroid isomerase-like protein
VSDAALPALLARLDALEAQVAIRGVMADYMRLCDRLDASTPMDQLGGLFTRDAVWEGTGARYGKAFGGHHGREAIVAMLDAYRNPPHFSLNAHFLTSEKITVQGDTAEGLWMMLQTATYSSGASDLRSARLTVTFVRRPSRWQISRFRTENIFLRPIDRWDGGAPLPIPRG